MTMQPTRRALITGLVSLVAAPAIVHIDSIMPVRSVRWGSVDLLLHCDGMTWEALRDGIRLAGWQLVQR